MSGPLHLGVDAGGTSTRAVVTTAEGECLGWAAGAAGNPTSAGRDAALAAITATSAAALADAGRGPEELGSVLVAMAGLRSLMTPADLARSLGYVGDPAQVRTGPDILAMYFSGAAEPAGSAVVAGTGSVAAVVEGGRVARAIGGTGWLLGDGGSGFAVGHAVVRGVVAELEGTGPRTALTPLLLAAVGLDPADAGVPSEVWRPAVLERLMEVCYADRPVALARHAPLAFRPEVAHDAVAARLVAVAQDDLARLVTAARAGTPAGAPLVLGGSTLHRGLLAPGRARTPLLEESLAGADVRAARDGAVGAAVAALAAVGPAGEQLPADVVERLHRTVAARRPDAGHGSGAGRAAS
ncbi:BadF/BadG/BcrA/BcrD ATPase family protein [Pseudokineococcus lusitanus]|uniref:N-acetylglucosamine kinase-like BadF-type ATPase n=1 Tax=Pseudokineococcus lusitanus TaxID=763993 RepID=A0A3N1GWF4_9ACTN|nr:BadF/BadG/BcrA/BcrD ATPase family protein [Pseudokineococcus lusitanus]ROP34522.1 N-acetylglucosamine kinase-like BadF-type ATPase [Pseudokineococcus lusitanus]